jgi:hypothetical protein
VATGVLLVTGRGVYVKLVRFALLSNRDGDLEILSATIDDEIDDPESLSL